MAEEGYEEVGGLSKEAEVLVVAPVEEEGGNDAAEKDARFR